MFEKQMGSILYRLLKNSSKGTQNKPIRMIKYRNLMSAAE